MEDDGGGKRLKRRKKKHKLIMRKAMKSGFLCLLHNKVIACSFVGALWQSLVMTCI